VEAETSFWRGDDMLDVDDKPRTSLRLERKAPFSETPEIHLLEFDYAELRRREIRRRQPQCLHDECPVHGSADGYCLGLGWNDNPINIQGGGGKKDIAINNNNRIAYSWASRASRLEQPEEFRHADEIAKIL
jgi:hypothetical protein